jgi:PIN domain nuclease of toxin-antitoxin system
VTLLLDTHVFLWVCLEPSRLSKVAASAIRRAARRGGMAIASISLWEIAMLSARGRVLPNASISAWLSQALATAGVGVAELTPPIAEQSTAFGADFPTDPADRIIAATARSNGAPLVTADERIRLSPLVKTIW